MTEQLKQLREAFERWAPSAFSRRTTVDEDGDLSYDDDWMQGAWVAYVELTQRPAAQEVDERVAFEAWTKTQPHGKYPLRRDQEGQYLADVTEGAWDAYQAGRAYLPTQPAAQDKPPLIDSMGMPTSCGKPLCSPDEHHPLCRLHKPAAQATHESNTEFCWLVEHFLGDGTGNSTGAYHTGFTDLVGNSRTTNDPHKAKRYDTQEKASSAAAQLGHTMTGTWRAVQHGFDATPPQQAAGEPVVHTYASTQATNCAGCGKHKHTPLRIDAMGGYVCLTCIDNKLGSLLGEFGYPEPDDTHPAPAVPDGFALVPVEPTPEMIHEVEHAARLGAVWTAESVYKAMLAARPLPNPPKGEV